VKCETPVLGYCEVLDSGQLRGSCSLVRRREGLNL
jgi:hypothetical protein